jgi:ribosomal protein S18 acetylase RimI-like enzyme
VDRNASSKTLTVYILNVRRHFETQQLLITFWIMASLENLYRLTEDDIDKASKVLRDAFIDYPTFRYLFPEINERKEKLRYVMRFFLKLGLLHGEVIAPSKNIEGVSIWYKSNNLNFGLSSLIKAGLISTIYNLNIKLFIKFKILGDAKKVNRDKLLDNEYYFLDLIGIAPSYEKQGYARLLLDSMIRKIDKESMSCFLETSNIRNIDYYTRFGFSLLSNYKYHGLESFCMIRNQM